MDKETTLSHFSRLVENGLDFLNKAIDEVETQPKYSVIHFHAAIEILLKARLMAEHWTLVLSQREKLDWKKFTEGNFRSVSLEEANDRLSGVVQSGLTKPELQAFLDIRTHRNKMVHFFHEMSNEEESNQLVRDIVKEQLTAWYFLHKLLTERWKEIFNPWLKNISKIHIKLTELHPFLQVIFEQIKPNIAKLKSDGYIFRQCPSCGFKSQKHENILRSAYKANCLVCSLSEIYLKIKCPKCSTELFFANEGVNKCGNCGKEFEVEDLLEAIKNTGDEHGNCLDCYIEEAIIEIKGGGHVCISCFTHFDFLQRCLYCDRLSTGDMEQSYDTGCGFCEGTDT